MRFVVSRGGRLLSLSFCSTICNVLFQTTEGGLIASGGALLCGGALAGGVLTDRLTDDALTCASVLTGGGGCGEEIPSLRKKRRLRLGVGGGSVACWDPCCIDDCGPELDCPPALPPGGALARFRSEAE